VVTPTIPTRRSFIQTAGTALSVPLAAAAAGVPVDAVSENDPLHARLAHLEDVNAIRTLAHAYVQSVNTGAREALAALFVDPSTIPVAPEIRAIMPDELMTDDSIEIAADRQTATARLHCTVQVETPIEPDCPLVDMARQQGGGVVRRTERGLLESVYLRREGVWKTQRSTFAAVEACVVQSPASTGAYR
jgi:hypothetical protein